MIDFKNEITRVRLEQGLSRMDLARKSKITVNSIRNIELSDYHSPNVFTVECLLEIMGYELVICKKGELSTLREIASKYQSHYIH
jgi:ribosome-binding protein aMBF1 (putative translation factor)